MRPSLEGLLRQGITKCPKCPSAATGTLTGTGVWFAGRGGMFLPRERPSRAVVNLPGNHCSEHFRWSRCRRSRSVSSSAGRLRGEGGGGSCCDIDIKPPQFRQFAENWIARPSSGPRLIICRLLPDIAEHHRRIAEPEGEVRCLRRSPQNSSQPPSALGRAPPNSHTTRAQFGSDEFSLGRKIVRSFYDDGQLRNGCHLLSSLNRSSDLPGQDRRIAGYDSRIGSTDEFLIECHPVASSSACNRNVRKCQRSDATRYASSLGELIVSMKHTEQDRSGSGTRR